MSNTDKDNAENQARAQLASIVKMVAALGCDYVRLQELREAKEALREEFDAEPANSGADFDNWARNQIGFSTGEDDELEVLEAAAGDSTDQDEDAREQAERTIGEDPLCIDVRSGWQIIGETLVPSEFRILLCTGGPAVQIIGDLGEHNEPYGEAHIQYQDWFTPWSTLTGVSSDDQVALDTYCRQFYFGE